MKSILCCAFLIVFGCMPSAPVLAHARLERAVPAVGSVIRLAPAELELTFSEPLNVAGSSITLADAGGKSVPLGSLSLAPDNGAQVIANIGSPLAPGTYHVYWHAMAEDGHRTSGDYAFTFKPAS